MICRNLTFILSSTVNPKDPVSAPNNAFKPTQPIPAVADLAIKSPQKDILKGGEQISKGRQGHL
jgi:hypothetical protein